RYLDIVLSLNSPGYLEALQRYRQVLRQRNQALRDGATAAALAAWSEGLVEWGSRVVAARAAWVARRAGSYGRYHADIGDGTPGRLAYASAVPLPPAAEGDAAPPAPAAVADSFRLELERLERRELERGMSLTGPHRDDFVCEALRDDGPVDLRQFGSGGQQRTAAVALRLVEAETIREHRGREPLVLLDDIMAELDPGRSRRLLELMEAEERGQVILTAPKPSDVEVRGGALAHWGIARGRVSTGAPAGPMRGRSRGERR
ncbi:MAG TPA: AAA family ATPase, partial [Longimicrobiales bacterium]|nr:AAA family ATPase [Longimicrobiales bacterium]